MYPSDRVWRNIQQTIHGIDRWPALTFGAILTLATLAVVLTITYPNRNLYNSDFPEQSFAVVNTIEAKSTVEQNFLAKKDVVLNQNTIENPSLQSSAKDSELELTSVDQSLQETALGRQGEHPIEYNDLNEENNSNILIGESSEEQNENDELFKTNNSILPVTVSPSAFKTIPETQTGNPRNFSYPTGRNEIIAENAFIHSSLGYGPVDIPKEMNGGNRWSVQVYATPSISYRYLLEDKKYVDDPSTINGPLAPYLTHSVNQFVRHNPKMGVEFGAAVLYQLADNFRLKTGLQLNYRQYGIEAYATQMQPAVLALNRGNSIDSVVRYTNISSQDGYRQLELASSSMQLAVPIGFDLRMAQFNKLGFFLSASGQLTYQLANNSYVLSADYKNYLKQPDLDRRFNINTAIEAFVSIDAGGVTWQAGPQIRYQMLPGTTKAYPIREHLIDYGLKVGVVKTLK